MAKEREQYEDLFYKVIDEFKKEVEKAKDPDLKRALYFAFKDYKDYLLEEYSNVIRRKKIDGKEPDMDSVIAEILMFDNNVYNEFNDFRKQIESQIEIKSSNYNGEYNRFKKCPHCGVIWFKIKGCNSVQCGKRTKATDKIVGKYKNYTVKYINGKIEIHSEDLGNDNDLECNKSMRMRRSMNTNRDIMSNNIRNPMMNNGQNLMMNISQNPMMNQMNQMNMMMMNQMDQMSQLNQMNQMNMNMNTNIYRMNNNIENDDEFIGLTRKENIENEKREKNGMIKITPVGCGRELNWDEMEDCSNEVIEKLKEIAVDDYYSGLMKVSNKINNE